MEYVIKPDLEMANQFLSMLDSDPAANFTFQTFDDNKARIEANRKLKKKDPLAMIFHGPLEQHMDMLSKLQSQGAGVFVMINKGDGLGRCNVNVISIRAQFIDLDGSPIEPVLASSCLPHIVVESSLQRWHAYWLVENSPLDEFKKRQHLLADKYGGDKSVCDLSRVMRMPGFWHLKGEPFQTRLVA
jgi:hypothetical protein